MFRQHLNLVTQELSYKHKPNCAFCPAPCAPSHMPHVNCQMSYSKPLSSNIRLCARLVHCPTTWLKNTNSLFKKCHNNMLERETSHEQLAYSCHWWNIATRKSKDPIGRPEQHEPEVEKSGNVRCPSLKNLLQRKKYFRRLVAFQDAASQDVVGRRVDAEGLKGWSGSKRVTGITFAGMSDWRLGCWCWWWWWVTMATPQWWGHQPYRCSLCLSKLPLGGFTLAIWNKTLRITSLW